MKRITSLLAIGLTIIAVAVLCTMYFSKDEQLSPSNKKYKTAAEMKAETILKKKARRAAGWAKPDKPSMFSEYHKRIRTKYGEKEPAYKQNYKIAALNKAKAEHPFLKSANALSWVERGPGNVSGRTRGLIIDPDDATGNTWFTGSVAGGVWKTTNAGTSWTNLTPNFPNLSTVSLAMSKSNTQVIYAGTGEGYFNSDAITGNGIFKTTDKGTTWTQLSSTTNISDFNYVNRIIVSPTDENIVLAATNTSIQKSIDGGTTWKLVYDGDTRVQQIVADPTNFETMYATAYSIGIIKSTNGGETWNTVLEEGTGRIEMAIAPSKTSILYALTEESKLYVSYDNGSSWKLTKITEGTQDLFLSAQGWYDNTLAVSPTDTNTVIIGGVNLYQVDVTKESTTSTSLYSVTTEGIESFMGFINHSAGYLNGAFEIIETIKTYSTIEVKFGPGMKQKAHRFLVPENSTSGVPASSYAYTDYVDVPFEVWDIENNRQLMISFRDQDRNGVFNLTEQNDTLLIGREYIYINDLAYSTTKSPFIARNGGHEFKEIAFWWPVLADGATWSPDNLPQSKITISRSSVYPMNLTSTKIADWAGTGAPYVHADLHNIQYTKTADGKTRIVVANDGGVGYSDDLGVTWTNPTNGYNTTQFYGIDKHPTENRYIGGMQDNGSWVSPESPESLAKWAEATGGDGFDAVWNAADPNRLISTLYNNSLYISYDGGNSWGDLTTGITDTGEGKAPFITQIGYSTSDPNKVYIAGSSGVTYSENFGKNWTLAEIPAETWGWSYSSFVEPSIAYPEVVWAASQMSEVGYIHVSEDGGKTFKPTTNYTESMGLLSGLATHPIDPKTAYALFSFAGSPKILRTTNMGESWEDITGFADSVSTNGFPDVATYCLLVMPQNPNEIWVGTEIGLFISTDNGNSWQLANNGLPAVSIWELKIRGTQVIAATHGRGLWTAEIPEIENATKSPVFVSVAKSPSNKINVKYSNEGLYDSLSILIDEKLNTTFGKNIQKSVPIVASLSSQLTEGTHTIQLIAYKDGIEFKSVKKELFNIEYLDAAYEYINRFDVTTTDFYGSGFSIENYSVLGTGMAIHTNHPYEENLDIYYLLRKPIIVQKDASTGKAIVSYYDIPFVEEGEPGSLFGSSDFYDYVVVEGTKNGVDWVPLLDGYDFREVKDKATSLGKAYDSTPSTSLFINHQANLLDNFGEGDTVLIRFMLHSDPFSAGWGWVIDNINIQGNLVSVKNVVSDQNKVYPIPCNQELTVELKNEFANNATISIFDISGKRIRTTAINKSTVAKLNTSDLKPNMYIIEISSGNKIQRTRFQVKR